MENIIMNDAAKELCGYIRTVNDIICLMYDTAVFRSGSNTDAEIRTAIKLRAAELLGMNLSGYNTTDTSPLYASIHTVKDIVRLAYDTAMFCASKYTEYETKAAIRTRAKELLDIEL